MTVADDIRSDEGWRPHVYKDSVGLWTIGYGFLVDPSKGDGMPQEVGDFWLGFNVQNIEKDLMSRWTPFVDQPEDVRRALVGMAYNLGVDGLLGFRLMLDALARGDRETASENALQSKWHGQVPARAERIAKLIAGNLDGTT